MYRQGDLLFIKTDKIVGHKKEGLDILKSNVTGHSHSLTAGTIYTNEPDRWRAQGNFYLDLPDGADLIHPEHKTINLPAGKYEVRRQREVSGYVRD